MDRDFNFVRVNKAYAEAGGRPAEDFAGKNHFDLYPHEESETIFRRVIETGKPYTANAKPFEHPDQPERGTTYWDFTLSPTFDDQGEIDGVLLALVDVTEHKRAEKELLLFKTVVETSREAIAISDANGRLIYINPAHERLFGRSLEEARHLNYRDYYPPGAVAVLNETVAPALARGESWEGIVDAFDACGRLFPLWKHAGSILDDRGRILYGFGMMHDDTERKRAEEKLIESEERLRTILDSIPDMVLQIDPDMGILWANKAALALNPDVIGRTCHNAFPGRESACEGCSANKSLETGKIETCVMVQPDSKTAGESHWEKIYIPLKDGKGEVASVIGISRNVTDRVLAEKKQRRIRKAESLNRMAGAVAHNFNNQLCVVIGNLEMAMSDSPPNSTRNEYLTEALQAANRSAEISGLLLTYVGRNMNKVEPMDLSDACRRNLPSFQGLVADGISFETDLMDTGPIVRAPSAQMKDILTRLITNAVEAIDDGGGKIVLATGIATREDLTESNLVPPDWKPIEDDYGFIEVADTGCGIASEHLDEIFDPFFTTKFIGRGLGLAVVLGIARGLNGGFGVVSRKGRGSTFRVFLPIDDSEIPSASKKEPVSWPMRKGDGVLLADDEDKVRKMSERMLERLGHSVVSASSGAEAVELFKRRRDEIGCAVIDATMPGMDGWETIAALRGIDKDIPIIMASGYDEAEVMGDGQSEPPRAFLHKPFSLADLKAAMADIRKKGAISK